MLSKLRVKNLAIAAAVAATAIVPHANVQASSCPDVKIIFARGSGEEKDTNASYREFRSTIEEKLKTTALTYEFVDLDYPAVGVGMDNLGVTVGAFFGAGDSYEFGESVEKGVRQLLRETSSAACPNTKYVVGGYSQGAMVISKALGRLNAENIIYAATFGDPKIYLPEGEGINPAACRNENLSDYRVYVPDCYAYKGLLGAYIPYEPEQLVGKLGTWCNKQDIFCSTYLNVDDHTSYVSDNLYEDASRVIFDKITERFGIERQVLSPHDTVFLIDSTGSMSPFIDGYKEEALRLATQTLESGGRVALFDYRDLDDPYDTVKHCDFEDCTLGVFQTELAKIKAQNGGDEPESMLSAAMYAMQNLNWQPGATKSLVVLTDANHLSPDRDGTTEDDVVKLSRSIDPVNIYVITRPAYTEDYVEITTATGGFVATDFTRLDELTDFIMERYDSLPRVEERDGPAPELPQLEIENIIQTGENTMEIGFRTNGTKTLVALNDVVLGVIEDNKVTITGLDGEKENILALAPLSDEVRGETVFAELPTVNGRGGNVDAETPTPEPKVDEDSSDDDSETVVLKVEIVNNKPVTIPKTPNTGRK